MTVAFCTFCHPPKYAEMLHRPGVLRRMVESHAYPFDDIVVIHQRCKGADYLPFDIPARSFDISGGEVDPILVRFGIDPIDPRADELSHGPTASHFWRWHLINHFRGAEVTATDYIVFADCDTFIKNQPPDRSWVEEGIYLLEAYPHVLIVGPGDGGEAGGSSAEGGWLPNRARLTQNVSQQLFICRGNQFRHEIEFGIRWDGKYDAPGGPMQEYYAGMLEGKLWLYMRKVGKWRAILPDRFRYWHFSQWDPPECYGRME